MRVMARAYCWVCCGRGYVDLRFRFRAWGEPDPAQRVPCWNEHCPHGAELHRRLERVAQSPAGRGEEVGA